MAVLAPGLISINIRALLPGYFSLLNTGWLLCNSLKCRVHAAGW